MLPTVMSDVAGVSGVALYLGAYAALQLGFLRGRGLVYPALNFLAAGLVLISLATDWNAYAATIQISWIVISLVIAEMDTTLVTP